MKKKNMCVVSGSRSDYDLLKPIMYRLKQDKAFNLICAVTGSHLLSKHGYTYKKIINDGFKINNKIKILSTEDNEQSILKSISKGITSFGKMFSKKKPDGVIVLGDRFEILAATISAAFIKIPIFHISGGEVSEGAIDENIRHAISKFSNYHFVANKIYKKRVIQLGENPKNVFCVGSTGPENINKKDFFNLFDLEKKLKFKFKKNNFLITYHSVTYSSDYGIKDFKILLDVLSELQETGLIFTLPNADTKNSSIVNLIKNFVKKNKNSRYFYTLGQKKYFSCIKYIDAVIGNSSSGLSEVPSFKKITINLGNRQKGRVLASSIINLETVNKKNIKKAIQKVYFNKFKNKILKTKNPYENGITSKKIVEHIKKIKLNKIEEKKFFDVNFKLSR